VCNNVAVCRWCQRHKCIGSGRSVITGLWDYTASSAYDEFVAGETYTDTFIVAADDGITKVITVDIVGTNDAALILGDVAKSLTETDAALSTSGALTISDLDGDNLFTSQFGVSGTYGQFNIAGPGLWEYTASSAYDELAAGATYTDTFTVAADDGTTQVITVDIVGTNDAAVIAGDTVRTANEGTESLSLDGLLTATDLDGTDNLFTAQSKVAGTNGYGQFNITTAGA
jgi:VCBS repeat-containing protein